MLKQNFLCERAEIKSLQCVRAHACNNGNQSKTQEGRMSNVRHFYVNKMKLNSFASAVRPLRVNKWKQVTKFLLPYKCRGTIFNGMLLFRIFNRIFVELVRTWTSLGLRMCTQIKMQFHPNRIALAKLYAKAWTQFSIFLVLQRLLRCNNGMKKLCPFNAYHANFSSC